MPLREPSAQEVVKADGMLTNDNRSSWSFDNQSLWASNLIDPSSIAGGEGRVMIQGEEALPTGVRTLSSTSPLFPHR